MIIMGTKNNPIFPEAGIDERLMGLQDIMPTLLDMCDIEIPDSVDGMSMATGESRPHIYGEWGEDDSACRMVRNGRYKLIYYPVGNYFQLFDMHADPNELVNLAGQEHCAELQMQLTETLHNELYGSDLEWLDGRTFIGLPEKTYEWHAHRHLHFQRGEGWPR